jgi:hypothetical protein
MTLLGQEHIFLIARAAHVQMRTMTISAINWVYNGAWSWDETLYTVLVPAVE